MDTCVHVDSCICTQALLCAVPILRTPLFLHDRAAVCAGIRKTDAKGHIPGCVRKTKISLSPAPLHVCQHAPWYTLACHDQKQQTHITSPKSTQTPTLGTAHPCKHPTVPYLTP
jgi:hypothetical protein